MNIHVGAKDAYTPIRYTKNGRANADTLNEITKHLTRTLQQQMGFYNNTVVVVIIVIIIIIVHKYRHTHYSIMNIPHPFRTSVKQKLYGPLTAIQYAVISRCVVIP